MSLTGTSSLRSPYGFYRRTVLDNLYSYRTCTDVGTQDPLGRTSEDTVYSCASSFTEEISITPSTGTEKTLSPGPSSVAQSFHLNKSSPNETLPSSTVTTSPPPRPPRAARPPKTSLPGTATAPKVVDKATRKPYCYDVFADYELPRASLESTRGCGRADSFELDPDLENEAAREFREGLLFARQALNSRDSAYHPAPSGWPASTSIPTQRRTDASDCDDDAGCFSTYLSPLQSSGPSGPSTSYVSLVSAFSSGSSNDGRDRSKLRKRARVPSTWATKALISSAIKKLSASTAAGVNATSHDSQLSSKSGRLRRRSIVTNTSQPSRSAPSISTTRSTVGSDNDSCAEMSARSSSRAPSVSTSQLTVSPAGSLKHKSTPNVTKTKVKKKDPVPATPSTDDPGKGRGDSTSAVEEGQGSLPSFHRGLRKQMYPPRVQYEVRQDARQQVRPPSPSASSAPRYSPRTSLLSVEHPSRGPRSAFDSLRAYSMG